MTYLQAKRLVLKLVIPTTCHVCGSPVVLSYHKHNSKCPRGCGVFCFREFNEYDKRRHDCDGMWSFYARPKDFPTDQSWWAAVERNTLGGPLRP